MKRPGVILSEWMESISSHSGQHDNFFMPIVTPPSDFRNGKVGTSLEQGPKLGTWNLNAEAIQCWPLFILENQDAKPPATGEECCEWISRPVQAENKMARR